MLDPIKNLVYVNTLIGYSASDLIITLQSGEGAKLPQPSTDGAFNLVWYNHSLYKNPADDPNVEIIRVTGRTGDVLTISRAQESTTATNKNTSGANYRLILGMTKKMIDDIQASLNLKINIADFYYAAGCASTPSITDNGNGSVTLGAGTFNLYTDPLGIGLINQYSIAGAVYSLTDLVQNYIVCNYNSGTPIIQVITDVTLINETTIIPIYSIYRNGTALHTQPWDSLGRALANKIHQSIVKTQRYRRESGLALSESGTRNLNLTSGIIWTGGVPMPLDAIATATDNMFFWKHVAGVWTPSTIAQYNNTQYDNGTDLATLSGGRYAVNWIFRGVENQKHLYLVLGTGDYTQAQAEAAVVPALPVAITSHAVLVAKVIVLKSAATALSIQSAFDTQFSFSAPVSHADLLNLDFAGSGHTGFAPSDAKGTDIASAGTINLGAATGNFVDITGTTTITALGTVAAGTKRVVRFTGALILTHNATSLILPTGANITTIAGDTATFISLGSGNWVCSSYQRKDGSALAGSGGSSLWTLMPGTPTRTSNTTFTVTGDITSYVAKGMIIKWTESGTVRTAMVSIPSTYGAPNTTITIIGDTMASIDSNSLKYCMLGAEMFTKMFAYAGTIGATATGVANTITAMEPMRLIGADLWVGTAGTTNSTTVDINIGGTTAFTTKPTLATTVQSSPTPFTADTNKSLALGDDLTLDIDAVQTTAAIDLYVKVYLFPTRYLSLS